MKPFIGTAIVGNGRMLAALGSNGELHRLFWPQIDMFQHIHLTWPAVLSPVFGERAVRVDDEGNWVYSQEYVKDTNILKTVAKAKRSELLVTTLDFVVPDRDIMVRCFEISNKSANQIPVVFLYYTSLHINESHFNNATCYDSDGDTLFHYKHDTWWGVAGNLVPGDFQCGWCGECSFTGNLNGNGISMAPDGCQAWNLGVIKPGQSRTLAVYLAAGGTRQEAAENIFYARNRGWDSLVKETAGFWENYLKQGYSLKGASRDIKLLFQRSLMVCKLLMNRNTGGIIAAPEFDQAYTCCGGYGYCWPRDAAFIAHAMLKAGFPDYARKFYRWAADNQNPGGGWPQRQYTNGQLAPGWGDQIDETGTVLWGMCEFYKETWDCQFIEEMWPTVVKAADFLMLSLDEETELPRISWDLWEERIGEHAYSSAAVYAGLKSAGQIAKALGEAELAIRWLETSMSLKEKILDYFWDPGLARFIRSGWISVNCEEFERRKLAGEMVREVLGPKGYITYLAFGDNTADTSLLGLTVPFGVIMADDERMQKTVRYLADTLANPNTGGIGRYSGDQYIGGNPWVLATLWLGMFEGAAGNWDKAAGCLDWALEHSTPLGFLPEQVDRHTGQTAWVVPLAWSHAMYIWLVNMMSEAKKL